MDYYKILGVSINSSDEEVKKAYHIKAHENHPDKGGDESKMKEINNAYDEIVNARKFNFIIRPVPQESPNRPIYKCSTCGKDTYYSLCIECWIKIKREEKRQRVHNIRSYMFCLNCDKSLYERKPNTLFCDTSCGKEYHKKRGRIKKTCSRIDCLSEEEAYRLKKIELDKVFALKRRERISIFTRLIGRRKALWFDETLQKQFSQK